MGTNTQQSTPSPNLAASKSSQSRQKLIAIAAVVIVALLAVNAWLLYNYTQANKAQATLTTQLDEANVLQEELNERFYEARDELKSLRSDNEQLNALITAKEAELLEQKDRIASLLRKGGSLDAARAELAKLNQQVDGYLLEVNQLREQNSLLADANLQLTQERDQFSNDLTTQKEANENLNQERALLVSEREQLSANNEDLSKKVNQASAIKVTNLKVAGQKIRKSGKPVTRRDAGNVEQIEVTFQTTVNEIASAGSEEFYIRIINSQGETLALNQLGSGVFTSEATGESMRYTMKDEISYDGSTDALRFKWAPGQAFSPGKYSVEVYNKGFLVGNSEMVLR